MPAWQLIIDLDIWKVMLGFLLILFSFFIYRRSFPPLGPGRRFTLAALRGGAFALLVLFMLDPALILISPEKVEPFILALVDISKSMSVADNGDESRLMRALSGAEALESSLRKYRGVDFRAIPFSNGLHLEIFDMDDISEAVGDGTDIAGSLLEAETMFRNRNLRAVVLFTDGRITRGMTRPVVSPSIPVFSIGIGDTLERPDVSIAELSFDRVVHTGTRASVVAVIEAPGFTEREIEVSLHEGAAVLDRKTVTTGTDPAAVEVTLRYTPALEGEHELRVGVAPVEGEERLENNTEPFRVRVLKESLRVLFIDQYADWNFTFLRRIADGSERVELDAVTSHPGRGFVLKPGDERFDFPMRTSDLQRYDLVIVSDDEVFLTEPHNMRVVAEYVERGGSLLLLADEHSPLLEAGLPEGLFPLIPVGRRRIISSELDIGINEGDAGHPLAILFEGMQAPPPIPARIAGFEATGAAYVPLEMCDRSGCYPFLALQRSGGGVTAVLLGFPLWRWMLTGGEDVSAYETLFGALIPYLAEGSREPSLTVEMSRTVYRTGEPVAVTAYTQGACTAMDLRGEVRSTDGGEEGLVSTFMFEPDLQGRGYARSEIGPLEPGSYSVTVTETRPSGADVTGTAEFGVQLVSTEFLKTSRDVAFLRYLAGLSGGRTFELEDAAVLPGELDFQEIVRERKETMEFRSSPLLLLATILFLSVEWLLRKFWGLV